MSYLKKIGALFVSSTLMAAMLTGCGGSSSASTGDSGSQAEGGDGNYNISIVFKTRSCTHRPSHHGSRKCPKPVA